MFWRTIYKLKSNHPEAFDTLKNLIHYYESLFKGFDNLAKLQCMYHLVNEYHEICNSKDRPVCGPNCGYCCYQKVDITLLEAELIAINLEIVPNKRYGVSQINGKVISPCPFLRSDHNCMIYEIRPFMCRLTFAFESIEKCKYGILQQWTDFHNLYKYYILVSHKFS
jgi:Fe-S-cluster containining protein